MNVRSNDIYLPTHHRIQKKKRNQRTQSISLKLECQLTHSKVISLFLMTIDDSAFDNSSKQIKISSN